MGQDDESEEGGRSSWTPHLLLLLQLPPPHASSLLTTREGSGGSLGWGLPAWAALGEKAEASHPTPPPPAGVQDCEGPDVRRRQGQALGLELTGSCAEARAPDAAA